MSVAAAGAGVDETLARRRDQAPIVAVRVQGERQHPKGRAVPHLAGRQGSAEAGQAAPDDAHHELANPRASSGVPVGSWG
jgi:hypothetical protein